jgi:hypothetical protein
MKKIKYKFLSAEINHGTEESPDIEQIFLEKSMTYSEANEQIAKREAHNGEYTIEEVPTPPAEEIAELKAKLAATDYQAIKYAEGALSAEEYEPTKIMRQEWRDRINELEVDA